MTAKSSREGVVLEPDHLGETGFVYEEICSLVSRNLSLKNR